MTHLRRRANMITIASVVAWVLLAAADVAAAADVVPWLPLPLHSLTVGASVTATLLAAWLHYQIPVRAAFLDGMLYERANPGGLASVERVERSAVKMASGDDSGGIVMHFPRAAGTPKPRNVPPSRR